MRKDIEAEVKEIGAGNKPRIIAARLPSMPIPEHIDKHLRGKNIKYLWSLTPIKNSPIPSDNGMFIGLWMNKNLDYVHLLVASEEVIKYYTEMNIHE
jgi:hypothetical protein